MGTKKQKRGRPPKEKELRSVRYTVRFTDKEDEKLKEIVTTLGLSVADYLRTKGFNGKNIVVNGVSLLASLDRVGAELGRSGNNINQLAKHANVLNKQGKIDESIMNRFNVLFEDYIKTQTELAAALRKIIREVQG